MVFGGSLERAFVLPGTVRVIFRDFAFLGQESTDAAVAARCAGRQDPGAYWRYHDLLFAAQQGENQGTFTRANLVTFAGLAALDATSFTACLDDPSVAKAVARRDRGRPRARRRIHADPARERTWRDENARRTSAPAGR